MRPLPIDDVRAPIFTVGQVAEMLGLHQSFLRRLDEHGIVSPARSAGGQRRYSRVEVDTVGHVVDLMGQGMGLAAVGRVLELQQQVTELRQRLAEATAAGGGGN